MQTAAKLSQGEIKQVCELAVKIRGLETEKIGALQDVYLCEQNATRIQDLLDICYASYWALKEPKTEDGHESSRL